MYKKNGKRSEKSSENREQHKEWTQTHVLVQVKVRGKNIQLFFSLCCGCVSKVPKSNANVSFD